MLDTLTSRVSAILRVRVLLDGYFAVLTQFLSEPDNSISIVSHNLGHIDSTFFARENDAVRTEKNNAMRTL